MRNKQKAWRRAASTAVNTTNKRDLGMRVGKAIRNNFTKFVPVPSFLVQALLMRGGWAYQQEVQRA